MLYLNIIFLKQHFEFIRPLWYKASLSRTTSKSSPYLIKIKLLKLYSVLKTTISAIRRIERKEGTLDVSETTSIGHDQIFKTDNKCKLWQDWMSLSLHKSRIYELDEPV